MKKLNLEQVSVQIDRDDLKTLRHLAVDADMSTSEIVREAVRQYLENRTEKVKPPETLPGRGRQPTKERTQCDDKSLLTKRPSRQGRSAVT
jgi:Ribbon-helix-helix protein, copG family